MILNIFFFFFSNMYHNFFIYQSRIVHRITNGLADHISKMIVSTFPTEVSRTYYIPPISKKDSFTKKSIIARGKLMNMWRNRCTLNKKFKVTLKKEETEKEEVEEKENGKTHTHTHTHTHLYAILKNHCIY
jgi:hypothetical protein